MAFLLEALDVELDGLTDELQRFIPCLAGCDTAGKIGNVGSKRFGALFDHNEVPHLTLSYLFKPACFSTLLSVPGGTSTPGLPATVTIPGFIGVETGDDFPWSEPEPSHRTRSG